MCLCVFVYLGMCVCVCVCVCICSCSCLFSCFFVKDVEADLAVNEKQECMCMCMCMCMCVRAFLLYVQVRDSILILHFQGKMREIIPFHV